ncbi:MAG: GyrI-like domain-containing protein [Melioribacteraceae bacterium]|nr:GyrI-like domain-containing protein [Melioribacteraceae bacterium]MCF8356486.1 GyrI-like domain-containing protein [Melioribacteraceae bacterium]MCF8394861.1 GyrI-like domain-containing protein [Melioribacteraceae bacterium]MCF8420589.1 GyrI-like domain-containing protein [Melioribacteraceae bacterium]
MIKLDLKKEYRSLYKPSAKEPNRVNVPQLKFLMIDGEIEKGFSPGTSPVFQKSVEALYGIAYCIKFLSKNNNTNPMDFVVMPLEGLWDLKDKTVDAKLKDNWKYTLMILQPDHITKSMFIEAVDKTKKKKENGFIDDVRIEKFLEGECFQMLHIGDYDEEYKTIYKMESAAKNEGCNLVKYHHEIYLSDPRKTVPGKMKTILRKQVIKN